MHTEKLKSMINAEISGKMLSSGISVIAFSSVNSEKTRLKNLIMIIIIIIIIISMNKSQELTFFPGRQKLTSAKN